jgi:hypothetical protein
MGKSSAEAEHVPTSGGESWRGSGLAMPMMEPKDKRSGAYRVQNRGAQQTGMDQKRRSLADSRNVTCGLRSDKAKRTLRGRTGLLSAIVPSRLIGSLMGSNAAEDKSIRRTASRHAEPDARDRRLDGKRTSDENGQETASRS